MMDLFFIMLHKTLTDLLWCGLLLDYWDVGMCLFQYSSSDITTNLTSSQQTLK